MSVELKTGSVLDLPIEEQRKTAKEVFGMELEEWQEMIKKDLAEFQEFKDELVIAEPVFTDDYTKEDFERFAQRIASANVAYIENT